MHQMDRRSRVLLREILVLFAALFLPGMLAQTGSIDPGAFNSVTYHVQTITAALAQCLLILHVLGLHPDTVRERHGILRLTGGTLLLGVALGLLLLGLALPVGLLEEIFGGRGSTGGIRFRLERLELVPLAILTSLAIGYREELFFRAFLIPRLEDLGTSRTLAVVISAGAFSLGHLYQGILGGVVTAMIGVLLAVAFLRRRNLHMVAIAHGLYNAAVLTTSYFVSG